MSGRLDFSINSTAWFRAVWGARFRKPLHPELERFSSSLETDFELYPFDIAGSIAHARGLGGDVQPPLGGDLLAPFGPEATVRRAHLGGVGEHLVGHSLLEIHARVQKPAQRAHVMILDVAAVLA